MNRIVLKNQLDAETKDLLSAISEKTWVRLPRLAKSSDDFGDEETVGLRVKKKDWFERKDEFGAKDFGLFAGEVEGKFYLLSYGAIMETFDIEQYDSVEEIKETWMLD